LVRRALKGELAVVPAAKALQDELLGSLAVSAVDAGTLAEESLAVESFKKATLMTIGLAMQTFGSGLSEQQEVLMHTADMLIETFSAESAVLRARNAATTDPRAELHLEAARLFVNDAAMRVEMSARQALAAMADGDTLRAWMAAMRRLFKRNPLNS